MYRFTSTVKLEDPGPIMRTVEKLYNLLQEKLNEWPVKILENNKIGIESVYLTVESENADSQKKVLLTWTNQDEDLGTYILGLLHNMG